MAQYSKSNPSKFIQEMFGVKLFKYQELIVDILSKIKDVRFNNNIEKIEICYRTYIKLLTHFVNMSDNDTVAIVSPNKTEILNREQFADYIIKFRNAHFTKYESEKMT